MNTGLSFVLAIIGWLCLSGAGAILVGHVLREAERHERDLRSIEAFDRARRPFRRHSA